MEPKNFSIRKRAQSFIYAGRGIRELLKSEHNARIHLAATVLVVVAAWALKVSRLEAVALTGTVGLVWVTEIFNTCVEKTMDFISTKQYPEIAFIKDLAAGAVLVASVIAVIVGSFIFIPRIL